MKIHSLLAVLGLLMSNPTMAQKSDNPVDQAVANSALKTLQALVNEQNARAYGFTSPAEAASATLGMPLPVRFVRLDELREFAAGQDPSRLLHTVSQVFLPVTAGGQVRSSILLEQSGERWHAVSFGSPNLARLLQQGRDTAARQANVDASSVQAVHVASLGRYYVASQSAGLLMLTAVTEDPELQIKAGETRPASEVFARLAPIARAYNGLPL